jgi:ATP adenylyltransferase
MDRLWAPWRIKYIKSKKQKRCIFCLAAKSPSKNYALLKTKYSVAMLNIYPYNNGHIMVSPIRHTGEPGQLTEDEIIDLWKTLNKVKKLLQKTLNPEGYNIGINIDKTAGAGITGHLHIHIVPRWKGDTNFMPALYNTKIVSQSLQELFKTLKHAQSKTD